MYVQQMGPDHDGFVASYRDEVLPALRAVTLGPDEHPLGGGDELTIS